MLMPFSGEYRCKIHGKLLGITFISIGTQLFSGGPCSAVFVNMGVFSVHVHIMRASHVQRASHKLIITFTLKILK